MCLLLVTPNKKQIAVDLMQNAYDHNSDGWGVMWADGGRVRHFKQYANWDKFLERWNAEVPTDKELVVHFRFGTSGGKSDETTHPFKVLSLDDGDACDLYLAHNGVLNGRDYPSSLGHSDTMEFVRTIAAQLKLAPALVECTSWIEAQENLIGGSKMVLLRGDGLLVYFNKQKGDEKKGVWFSNLYSIKPVYSGHGNGRAAQDDAPSCNVTRYNGGTSHHDLASQWQDKYPHLFQQAESAAHTQKNWLYDVEKGIWWKPQQFGTYLAHQRDAQGRMVRISEYVKGDFTTKPPGNLMEVKVSDVAKFESQQSHPSHYEAGIVVLDQDPEDYMDQDPPTQAEQEAVLEAQARDVDPPTSQQGPTADELRLQEWSDANLREIGENGVTDLCFDDYEMAALTIGRLLNCHWAYEPGSFDKEEA